MSSVLFGKSNVPLLICSGKTFPTSCRNTAGLSLALASKQLCPPCGR